MKKSIFVWILCGITWLVSLVLMVMPIFPQYKSEFLVSTSLLTILFILFSIYQNRISGKYLWIMSAVLMLFVAMYQRVTGPTYPLYGETSYSSSEIQYRLPRSCNSGENAQIKMLVKDESISGFLKYSRYVSNDSAMKKLSNWVSVGLSRSKDTLWAEIPSQQPAGKIIYQIFLTKPQAKEQALNPEPTIIRFKGQVPSYFLIPHIIIMFLTLLFAARTGFEALFKNSNVLKLAVWTSVFLIFGGMILGPIIQYYAFGVFWSGFPLGHDLTDNKTAAALLFWIFATWQLKRNPNNKWWALLATIVLIIVYMVPHSMLGSELDYTKIH